MQGKKNRISFSWEDAGHIYELLRFYWIEHEIRYPGMKLSTFGNCGICESIGERLKKFIGKDEVKFVDDLAKKHKKKYEK